MAHLGKHIAWATHLNYTEIEFGHHAPKHTIAMRHSATLHSIRLLYSMTYCMTKIERLTQSFLLEISGDYLPFDLYAIRQ